VKRINYFLLGILISFALLFFGCATVGRAADWTPEQKELIALNEAFNKAFTDGDTAKLDQLMADNIDYKSSVLKGRFTDKASFLEAHRKWYVFSRAVPSPVSVGPANYTEVKINGDYAVVTCEFTWSQRSDRGIQQGVMKSVNGFKRINGEWKIIS
jgi:hypothetical protein